MLNICFSLVHKSQNMVLVWGILFNLSLWLSCFLCLSCLLTVLLPNLSSFFCMELWLANFLGRGNFNLQRVVCKQWNWQWIFPQNVTFFVSVTLTGLVRISKTRFRWKDLSLKKLLFINLYPASRGSSFFIDKSGRLKERWMMRQNRNNTRALNKSSFEMWKPSPEFRETNIFYICHSKGLQETVYFWRNITMTTRTYSKSTDQLHLRVAI